MGWRGDEQVMRQAAVRWLGFWFVSFCLSRKSFWVWMGLTSCSLIYWNWEYWVSKSFSQPRKDEWIDQLLLWLHWISVAAMTQLQPGQKGLGAQRAGSCSGGTPVLARGMGALGRNRKVPGDTAVGAAYKKKKKKGADPCRGKGSGKAGTAWCPISALAKWQSWS